MNILRKNQVISHV